MNWDAIGAIGQMLGAAAVFISLGYLGVQLRGANLTAKHASQNSFIGDYTRFLSDLYLHPEVVDMTRKGFLEGLASLDQNEKERFHCLCAANYLFTVNMYVQSKAKQFDEALAQGFLQFFAAALKTKGGNEWWNTYKKTVDLETAHIDSLIADSRSPSLVELQPWWGAAGRSAVNARDK